MMMLLRKRIRLYRRGLCYNYHRSSSSHHKRVPRWKLAAVATGTIAATTTAATLFFLYYSKSNNTPSSASVVNAFEECSSTLGVGKNATLRATLQLISYDPATWITPEVIKSVSRLCLSNPAASYEWKRHLDSLLLLEKYVLNNSENDDLSRAWNDILASIHSSTTTNTENKFHQSVATVKCLTKLCQSSFAPIASLGFELITETLRRHALNDKLHLPDDILMSLVFTIEFASMVESNNHQDLSVVEMLKWIAHWYITRRNTHLKKDDVSLKTLEKWVDILSLAANDEQSSAVSREAITALAILSQAPETAPFLEANSSSQLLPLARKVSSSTTAAAVINRSESALQDTKRSLVRILHNSHLVLNSNDAKTTNELLNNSPHIWAHTSDCADIPILEASAYCDGSSMLYGWVDILSEWSFASDRNTSKDAVSSLVHWVQSCKDDNRRDALLVLQAWLLHTLRALRSHDASPEVLRAVHAVEATAALASDDAPGTTRLYDLGTNVLAAGVAALSILAARHYDHFLWHGGLELVLLIADVTQDDVLMQSQCARVIANLAATSCSRKQKDNGGATTAVDISAAMSDASPFGSDFLMRLQAVRKAEVLNLDWRSNALRALANMSAYRDIKTTTNPAPSYYTEGTNLVSDVLDDDEESNVDIVLVHGLRGHPFSTWRTKVENDESSANHIWPKEWLLTDELLLKSKVVPRVITLGYDAGLISTSSPWPPLTLAERASEMLKSLEAANVGSKPVVFVTHSMGGLLVKELLVLSTNLQRQKLLNATRGIVFIAVPHSGAHIIGKNSEGLRRLLQAHPATKDLSANAPHLRQLDDAFQNVVMIPHGVSILSLAEGQKAPIALGIKALVVNSNSANPGYGEFHVLENSNHIDISKPENNTDDPRYWRIRDFLVKVFKA